ncbi:MAG: ABC transporter substrate-binding protein [Xanthobacteraceae bacterium]|jgi:putative ABC transport system substrate-binding protein
MKRREFIAALGGVAALPFAARAQQAMPVIGFLRSTSERGSAHLVKAFRAGLNDAGFVDGQNVAIEYRWAEDRLDRLPGMVADLVQRQVAVIVVNTLAAQVAVKATKTVPLVFASGSDPIRLGLVASLNRPGGNVTGVVFTVSDLMAKRLGLLRDLAPKAAVVAVLLDSNYPEIEIVAKDAETAGRAIGQQVLIVKAAGEDEFDAAFAAMVKAGAGALLVGGGPTFNNRRRQLVALAARHGLPASYVNREYADDGGLMTYGASQTDGYRRAGIYVGRVLKGTKPADLPVALATKFELVLNLRTAKALGLTVPSSMQLLADEVIE